MLIVGERINSTRSSIQEAIRQRNAGLLVKEAADQIAAGAVYVDINCAVTSGDEVQEIDWAVSVIQSAIKGVNICVDSPSFLAVERALSVYKAGGLVMVNSITAEESRMKSILPLAKKHGAKLVALTISDEGMPDSAEGRFAIAGTILERARSEGFPAGDLYFDALIRPVSTEPSQAREFLRSIPMIKSLGGAKTICGLSNVSFGLPDRRLVNAAFLAMAAQAGLDAAILDPTDKLMMSSIMASEALLGRDEYCGEYIRAFREGKLV